MYISGFHRDTVDEAQERELLELENRDFQRRKFAVFALLAPICVTLLLLVLSANLRFATRALLGFYFHEAVFVFVYEIVRLVAGYPKKAPCDYALKFRSTKDAARHANLIWLLITALALFYLPFFFNENSTQIGSLYEAGRYKELYYADVAYHPNAYTDREVHNIPVLIERCDSDCESERSLSHYHVLYMIMPYDGPTPFVFNGMEPYDNIVVPGIERYVPTEGEDCGYYITLSKERAHIK